MLFSFALEKKLLWIAAINARLTLSKLNFFGGPWLDVAISPAAGSTLAAV